MTFDCFSFDQRINAGIKSCGFTVPTPIQTVAIPEVLKGRDVMGLAQTGTGKTAAFALPILQRLLDSDARGQGPVRTLVLAPTRELALQIQETFDVLGRQTGIRSACVFGGVGFNPQINAARRSTVVVACPGRLLALLRQGDIRLDHVDTLVLDEADRMLDMGFMPDLKRIMERLPAKRQNLLFSATMPADIRKLADTILVDPARVQVSNTEPVKSVSQAFYPVSDHLKANLLEALIGSLNRESVLIFTRTKHKAKNLAKRLGLSGLNTTFLQGNMSQNQRQRALDGFRCGDFDIMVATDIAARGIDCERISHVINFDAPDTAETYTHRIGRTGRAGRTGEALSLITREDHLVVRDIERVLGRRVEVRTMDGFDYDQPFTAKPGVSQGRPRGGAVPAESQGRRAQRGRRGGQRASR
ncbi:DEAD/DEAH box helicase [Pseudodesulfovibrio pelocollis]|uniref:DEAD/DEAH box helicase n=1 Tax=Pseudodesulfovibrio pelocollis TaxID=3051432 RepID=UPI00255A9136|nr:DEAD/DEAH box helicase [Pseudodesulfovibrio sp. SB368]